MTLNRIITADDYCKRDNVQTVRERILKMRKEVMRRKNIAVVVNIDKMSQRPVYGRIELGQWVADCECGGVEFVSPNEPVFFCFSCGNAVDAGDLRPVIFPSHEERAEIERLVLERPVYEHRGLDDMERAHGAQAQILIELPDGNHLPLTRSWNPHESIDDLKREQEEAIRKWKETKRSVE